VTLSDDAINALHAARNLSATWGITLYGVITSHATAMALASLLSGLQIYILVRDKLIERKRNRAIRKGIYG